MVALLSIAGIWVQFSNGEAGDKVWLLTAAHEWLEGKKLYEDIFEINPPLIVWLYSVPVYLSVHCPVMQDYHFLALIGILVAFLSTYLSLQLIRFHPEFIHNHRKQTEFWLLLLLIGIIFQNPTYFADREHLFLMLAFPYILRFMPALAHTALPKRLTITIGVLAGLGFCLKPHLVIIFAGINLIYIWRERSVAILKSAENIPIYLLYVAYGLTVWLLTPQYLTIVVPMALATYSAAAERKESLFFMAVTFLYFGITFADFRLRYHSPYRRDILYLLAVAFFFICYALANNGWGYTWNLPLTLGLLIAGFVFWEHAFLKKEYEAKGLATQPFVFGMRACGFVFVLNALQMLLYAWVIWNGCGSFVTCEARNDFVKYIEAANDYQKVSSFGAMTNYFHKWSYYSKSTGAHWDTRFNHLWMLDKFLISGATIAPKDKWVIDYVGKAYSADLETRKPPVVFVDSMAHLSGNYTPVDFIALLLQHSPEFAREWKHYRYAGRITEEYETKGKPPSHRLSFFVYQRIN